MPITKSAGKALRGSQRKRVFNNRRKGALKAVVKEVHELLNTGKIEDAEKLLPHVYQTIDKAKKTNVIKKNTADRKKSQLVRAIKRQKAV